MKLSILFIFLIVLIFPLVSAVQIESKDSFLQDETFIAKISGNFYESPSEGKITFHREHVRVSIIPHLVKIGEDFYVYAQLYGKTSGNYSMTLEDTKYYDVLTLVEQDIVFNFTISNESADFFVEPAVVSSENDFSLEVQNLRNDKITVSAGDISSLTLKAGEKKNFNFLISDFENGLNSLRLETESTITEAVIYSAGESQISSGPRIRFENYNLNISLSTDSQTSKKIILSNTGAGSVRDITFSVSESLKPYVEISEKSLGLEEGSDKQIEFVFTSDDEEKIIEGEIRASSGNISSGVSITLNFIKDYVQPPQGRVASCSELGGNLCSEGETCTGDLEFANDGNCCLDGLCQAPGRSRAGMIVGWILIAAVALYVLWFYLRKYKKVNKPKGLLGFFSRKKK